MDKDEKVAIFIDGANIFHGLLDDFSRIDLDYECLVNKLVGERRLTRVYYYAALPNQQRDPERYKKQQKFLASLDRKPYFKVVYGRLEPRPGNLYVEKGVDVALAIDMLDLAYNDIYDTAIIISGDGDFAKAVEIIQRRGKHVENAVTPSCLSNNLRNICDIVISLDANYLAGCWRNPTPPRNG
ncbi:MAG: LabA-like NYN domain-containing protein [Bellilinea sp.]